MLFPKNIGSAVDAIDDDVHIYDCYDTASVLCCDSDLFATLFFPTRYGLKQLESTADSKEKIFHAHYELGLAKNHRETIFGTKFWFEIWFVEQPKFWFKQLNHIWDKILVRNMVCRVNQILV